MPKQDRIIVRLKSRRLRFINRIARDTFLLPNGEQGQWDSIWTPPEIVTCLVLAFTKERRIVLVRMWRFPVQEYVTELPGGDSKPRETPEQAAKRELLEETGYSTTEPLLLLTQGPLFCGKSTAHFMVFLAQECTKTQEPTLDLVEQYAEFRIFEEDPLALTRSIAEGERSYDPPLMQALLVAHLLGYIQIL